MYLCIIEQLLSQNFGTVKIVFEGNILFPVGHCRPCLFLLSQSFPDIGLQIQTANCLVNRLHLGPLDGPLFKAIIFLYLKRWEWILRLILKKIYRLNGRLAFFQVGETGNGTSAHVQSLVDLC